jgi:F-type H+-transporting ATPase subunit epsilon
MTTHNDLRLVLVTPETTLLDEPVAALRFPLYDGQIGILPGRAPLVGRLGYGELQITETAGTKTYFVDGGFVQVKGNVVSLLTNRAQTAKTLDPKQAENELQSAQHLTARTDDEFDRKLAELERARRKLALARKTH